MSEFLNCMKEYGMDVDATMKRFLNDEAMYRKFFVRFLEDKEFANLKEAIENKNYREAFEASHDLKGVSGNMGLTPLYGAVCLLVEDLRAGRYDRAEELYQGILTEKEKLSQIAERFPLNL